MRTLPRSAADAISPLAAWNVYIAVTRSVTIGVRVVLALAAMNLQRILPMVWALVPDVATAIACLAFGCNVAAEWID